jgi:hypothetical protein
MRARHLAPLLAAAAVAAASGVSFAADTGTVSAAVAAGARGPQVTTLGAGTQLPDGVSSLPHDGALPALARTAGDLGDVHTAGDVFLVDTRGLAEDAHASLYVTNLAELSMRSFVLPVGLWSARDDGWRRDGTQRFLTSTGGQVELTLAPGRVYTVSLERGGTWAGGSATTVAPQLYLAVS